MLCRALIAAAVVTCTLLCIPANGQGAQSLDRIKDLMCVFLLSGMQKEDLDVDMLTKLQQHNVNINDMNNDEIIQACLASRNNTKIKNNSNKTTKETHNQSTTTEVKDMDLDRSNTVYKRSHFIDRDGLLNASTVQKSDGTYPENEFINSFKNIDENISNNNEQHNKGQPNLENVLQFWNNIKFKKAEEIKEPKHKLVVIKEPESEKNNKGNLHLTERDAITKLLTTFLSKSRKKSIHPTTQIHLNNGNMSNISELGEIKKIPLNIANFDNISPYLPNHNTDQIEKQINEDSKNYIEMKPRHSEMFPTNFTDMHTLLKKINNYKPFNVGFYNDDRKETKQNLKLTRNPYLNTRRSENIDTTTATESFREVNREMIKEIAESVKEIILKDLRKEIHERTISSTTYTITTTTTATPSTTRIEFSKPPLKQENIKAESLMNKFLDLFEEIKALKQNYLVITNENKKDVRHKDDNTKELKIQMKSENVNVPTNLNHLQSNIIKQYPTPNARNVYNFAPQLHKFRSNVTMIKQESNKSFLPITVQTNNIEVPPIRISLDKPLDLINQNIIVTTNIPYRIATKKMGNQHLISTRFDRTKASDEHKPKQLHMRFYKEPNGHSTHHFHSNYKDDVIRFTLNNNDNSKYNTNYYEKFNLGKYKTRSDRIPYELKRLDKSRFHEKLENVEKFLDFPEHPREFSDKIDCCNERYGFSKTMVDCCNRKIASRQQMSLNNIKKNSYDDIHFKNFLQSQQKVTDMLERILADRGDVSNVETA